MPKQPEYLIDTKVYSVTAPNGFRRGGLTEAEARAMVARMRQQMQTAGWAGKVQMFYRDGTEVTV